MTEHQCRWLKGIKCWQTGKRVKKSECTPCLIVRMWMSLGWTHNVPKAKKGIDQ